MERRKKVSYWQCRNHGEHTYPVGKEPKNHRCNEIVEVPNGIWNNMAKCLKCGAKGVLYYNSYKNRKPTHVGPNPKGDDQCGGEVVIEHKEGTEYLQCQGQLHLIRYTQAQRGHKNRTNK